MKFKLILSLIIVAGFSYCGYTQINVYGKYAKSDTIYPKLTESIVLKRNHTFEYFRRAAFTEFRVSGKWHVKPGYLLLNSSDSINKNSYVTEKLIKSYSNDSIKIHISYLDGAKLFCTVVVNEGSKDSGIKYNDVYDSIVIPKKNVATITVYSVIRHSTYFIKNRKSNYLNIKLNENRIFNNENWLFMNNKQIVPVGLNGAYVNYSLNKE